MDAEFEKKPLKKNNIKYACELVEKKYKLKDVPTEDAMPLFGITKCFKLGKFSCCNPYKYEQWKQEEDLEDENDDEKSKEMKTLSSLKMKKFVSKASDPSG